MKLSSFKYSDHSLNFDNSFHTSTGNLKTRDIFIIELQDDAGNSFYGEAAPLPKFNSESFSEVENELQRLAEIKEFQTGTSFNEIFQQVKSITNLSTVQYAIEQIFLSSIFKNDQNTLQNFAKERSINVNAVLGIHDFESSQQQIIKIIEQGYRTIKLKTGKDNFEDLYELLTWAIGELEAKVKFRIDPNGSWNKKETLTRCERLHTLPIEYIEQPVMDKNELIEVAAESPIPIAADESVRTLDDAQAFANETKLKFLIIKPMLFGGIANVIELKKMIENKDIKTVVSSSLESNVGRRNLVLATAIIDNNLAHGLGTANMFINQPTTDVFPVEKGKIDFSINKYLAELKVAL